MPTAGFYTLGCKLNFSETSTLARQFREQGYTPVPFHQPADVYLINTCSVTENADRKCRKVVQQAKRRNPNAYVVIVGCYAQLKPQEIREIPGVNAVLGAAEKFQLFEHLPQFDPQAPPQVFRSPVQAADSFVPTFSLEERTRAFLKVQDGCDYKCSFCTIPLARGASRSQALPDVLAQVEQLAAQQVREVVISGINLGDYRGAAQLEAEPSLRCADLLESLDRQAPASIARFRISSIEPNLLENRIIELVAQSARFVPHFHIPLQSGSNRVLARMRRRYQRELYAERIAAIRRQMPQAAIGVDVIVGFPGETEADFMDTYTFLQELAVSYLHVFPFSARANTPAADLPHQLDPSLKAERADRLRTLSEKKRHAHYTAHSGQLRPVLFEQEKNGRLQGWTDNYIRVDLPYDPLLEGELAQVRLGEWLPKGVLSGEVLATPQTA